MANNRSTIIQYSRDIVAEVFKKKEDFHRRQACLPIQEKIKILVELQKIALTVRPKVGPDDRRMVWQLSGGGFP